MVFAFPHPDYPPTERAARPDDVSRRVSDRAPRRQVAIACRVIALEGYVDLTLGPRERPRARRADRSGSSARASALDEVEPDDVIALDLDDPDALEPRPTTTSRSVMHTEVYRARPDVNAVIHGHPLYGTALGSTDAQLRMLTHDAVLFVDGLGSFDEGPRS